MSVIEYQRGDSFLHNMSPIGKFIWGLIIVLWLFLMFNPLHVLALGVVILLLAKFAAGLSILRIIRTSFLVGIAGVSIILFQTFLSKNGQTPIFQLGPLIASQEGLYVGLAIALRVLGIVAASTIVAKTTDPHDIVLALVKIGMPYKIAYGLFTALRFIPLMENDVQTITDAQYVRGITRKKGGIFDKARGFILLLVPLLAGGMRRAEQSALAMDVRAFGLYPTRTYHKDLAFKFSEWVYIGLWLAAFVGYIILVQGDLASLIFYTPPSAPGK